LNLKLLLNKYGELDNIENYLIQDLYILKDMYLKSIDQDEEGNYHDPKFKDVTIKIKN